jgi:iron complex outermembrane receptor protein
MIKKSLLFVFVICTLLGKSQDSAKVVLSGSIKDSETGEALIGATVLAKVGVGVVADLEGNFVLKLPKGDYTIEVSMLGYGKFTQKLKLYSNKKIELKLESNTLDEVEVIADMAQIRETPVAFSSISAAKIQEELGGKDISMIANTTPGAYASSSGGGAGDSRVTLRGFDQRNIAVMVDGIPVNDMENGQVYWSNWDGLKDITKSMQIQRGLGATKLAISSVGGTMNFITNGIDGKQQMVVKKEWGNNGHSLMGLSYNSGIINNKWGFTLAGTYKTGDGWAEQTWTNAYSYFAKIQYMPNPRHIISIGANGAPQTHGQRTTKVPIVVYSKEIALKSGIDYDSEINIIRTTTRFSTQTQGNRDLRWNPDQGILNGTTFGDRTNFYHKPLININHFWKVNESTTISTVAYASFGKGGGASYSNAPGRDTLTGYYLVQSKYDANSTFIDPNYSLTEHKSTTIIRALNNNHNWYGLLSTATSKLSKMFTLTYGIDLRYYKGIHTTTVYNLLGGDYFTEGTAGTIKNPNLNNLNYRNFYKNKEDIIGSNYEGYVKWGGLFLQGEFKKKNLTAFVTATGSYTGFNRIDYYKNKDLILNGKTYRQAVGYGYNFFTNGIDTLTAVRNSTITTNGDTTYVKNSNALPNRYILNADSYDINSSQSRYAETDWLWQLGFTIKGGVNFNLNEHHNIFANIGVMQIPQKFTNVFTFSNEPVKDLKPQFIQSYEIGYGAKYNKLRGTINAYYTLWNNQPQNTFPGADGETYNVNGVNLIYKGIEFEATYKPIKYIELEGLLSLGDWIYNSGGIVYTNDINGNPQPSLNYSALGVHVGNAAQKQFGMAVRFMPFKGFYFKPRYTYFDKNYANFDPVKLQANNKDRESWMMPGYGLLDLSTGYDLPFGVFKLNVYATINNVLNTIYINDGQNNGASTSANGWNAASASVFFGAGRTFVVGTKLTF